MKTNDLRVISGQYRGQRLRSPESHLTHPMGAREKLALFNLLQPYFNAIPKAPKIPKYPPVSAPQEHPHAGATLRVLDLYAGSGAIGIEALSRGAREVVFVEKSPKISHLISENLTALNPGISLAPSEIRSESVVKIFSEPVADFCARPEYLSYFDIIIADPPYNNFHPEDLASISQILGDTGVFILSSPAKVDPPELPDLQQKTTRTYAAARLTVYQNAQTLTT